MCILSTDMSKAFDSLCPSLLLKRLEAYGFTEQALELMRSYFEDRLNRVKIGNTTSKWREMTRGCPQGSSFGPLTWNIFQNDLALHINSGKLNMYADDHQIYSTGHDLEKVRATIVEEGELAATWYKKNYLLANIDKYQTTVNDANTDKCGALKIHDQTIESADHIRLLGVDIDNHVTFSKHISETCKKASSKIAVITRFCNLLSTKANLKIYKSFILPNLTYCHTVWHFCRESDSRKIERVQEKALRVIYKAKTGTYAELLRRAELPSLRNRRMQDIMIYMYKVKHGLAPKHISDTFTVKATQYSLRNSDYLIPRFNTVV